MAMDGLGDSMRNIESRQEKDRTKIGDILAADRCLSLLMELATGEKVVRTTVNPTESQQTLDRLWTQLQLNYYSAIATDEVDRQTLRDAKFTPLKEKWEGTPLTSSLGNIAFVYDKIVYKDS